MADGKWISDLDAGTPLRQAARHVLGVRLDVVREYLPLAVHHADDDPEHVHQLRVGTRRAGAALTIFAACLPEKVYDHARKQLRRVRRAAGAARDWDVFLSGLDDWRQRSSHRSWRPGLDCLSGYALAQRVNAQAALQAAVAEHGHAYDQLTAETVAAVHRPRLSSRGQTLLDLARPLLLQLVNDLDKAVARDLTDYDNLHQVRIAGKHLRYAMEVFAECFVPAFREQLYPMVEEMQEILGNANDSHVATQRLDSLGSRLAATRPVEWKRFEPGIEGLLRFHRKRLPAERERFCEWWQRWQETGAEQTLTDWLYDPGPRRRRAAL